MCDCVGQNRIGGSSEDSSSYTLRISLTVLSFFVLSASLKNASHQSPNVPPQRNFGPKALHFSFSMHTDSR